MYDFFETAAAQVSNPCSGACPGADSPAVSGKPADGRFLMDGCQVGQSQGPVLLILIHLKFLRIYQHGNRGSDTLVAASRINDDRQLTAIHPGVRTCCCHGLGPGADIISRHFQKNRTDIGAVIPF